MRFCMISSDAANDYGRLLPLAVSQPVNARRLGLNLNFRARQAQLIGPNRDGCVALDAYSFATPAPFVGRGLGSPAFGWMGAQRFQSTDSEAADLARRRSASPILVPFDANTPD
jgi:hypothetical protein